LWMRCQSVSGGTATGGRPRSQLRPWSLCAPIRAVAVRSRRAYRPPPAMPVLRRTHDLHRGVQTLASAARAAGYHGNEPGEYAMTRHDLFNHAAVSPLRRPTGMLVPDKMKAACTRKNAVPIAGRISTTTPGNTFSNALGSTNAAATRSPSEPPKHKTP
jgi:hypothetical protein